MSSYAGPDEPSSRRRRPSSYLFSRANGTKPVSSRSSSPSQSSTFSSSSSSSSSGSSSGSSSSSPSSSPQRAQDPRRGVGFASSPVSAERRPPTPAESWALKYFEEHARACSSCHSPTRAQRKKRQLCVEGQDLAKRLAEFLHRKDGVVYSTGSNPYKLIHVELPSEFKCCKKLLRAIEHGMLREETQHNYRYAAQQQYQPPQNQQSFYPNANNFTGAYTSNTPRPMNIPTNLQPSLKDEERRSSFKAHNPPVNADKENQPPQEEVHQHCQHHQQPHRHSHRCHRHQHRAHQPSNSNTEHFPQSKSPSTKRFTLDPLNERDLNKSKSSNRRQRVYVKDGQVIVDWPDNGEAENVAVYNNVKGPRINVFYNGFRAAENDIVGDGADDGSVGSKRHSRKDGRKHSRKHSRGDGVDEGASSYYCYHRGSLYDDDLADLYRARQRYNVELREPSWTSGRSPYYTYRRPRSSWFS